MATQPPNTPDSAADSADKVSVVTSRPTEPHRKRLNFVAGAVLLAAALLAVTVGLMGYNGRASITSRSHVPVVRKGQGAIYLEGPAISSIKKGETVQVAVNENSGEEPINAVQVAVTYPADKLQVVNVRSGTGFPQEAATDKATPGLVRFARGVSNQSASVKGVQQIATLEFKVISDQPPLELKVDRNFSLLVRSTDNRNILPKQ